MEGFLSRSFLMEPTKVEYNIGENLWRQPLKLIRHRTSGGNSYSCWCLQLEQANQRDDSAAIDGLTDENLRAIASIIGAAKA
jgi:hypothetical protein